MTLSKDYTQNPRTREQIDATGGPGWWWSGLKGWAFCGGAGRAISPARLRHPGVPNLKVEDGPGRALGRSFRVKLWPTLVFLSDGQEVSRLVRPADAKVIEDALAQVEAKG